ncbi:hypothetical protein DEW08_01260 [Azospirillum thermophilum]|uniref:Histidine-type phosphatase n=1 Tax=Azospirillum thermophilum TaxID=2202148 RepID=A0A2S2CKE9_9PROT|nr:hypothetical protein DEW08_01260 [Azospirillum thermophilum]
MGPKSGLPAAALAAAILGGTLLGPAPAAADADQVEKAVLFSRHGVRPPTETHKVVPLSTRPWPSWPVPDGHLTPHGKAGAVRMGEYYRQRFAREGLLPSSGCPAQGEIFAWANTDQRTRETGNGILEGLYPGCGLTAGSKSPPPAHATRSSPPLPAAWRRWTMRRRGRACCGQWAAASTLTRRGWPPCSPDSTPSFPARGRRPAARPGWRRAATSSTCPGRSTTARTRAATSG